MIAMMDLKGLFNTSLFNFDRMFNYFIQKLQKILVDVEIAGVTIFTRINFLEIFFIFVFISIVVWWMNTNCRFLTLCEYIPRFNRFVFKREKIKSMQELPIVVIVLVTFLLCVSRDFRRILIPRVYLWIFSIDQKFKFGNVIASKIW